ncbi:hypothetical protein JXA05_00005, partial [Candidatus Peregrinibacteria bacterium]|nr:hypothetical protein [Candidatus Peregrinibacteria bacterium]
VSDILKEDLQGARSQEVHLYVARFIRFKVIEWILQDNNYADLPGFLDQHHNQMEWGIRDVRKKLNSIIAKAVSENCNNPAKTQGNVDEYIEEAMKKAASHLEDAHAETLFNSPPIHKHNLGNVAYNVIRNMFVRFNVPKRNYMERTQTSVFKEKCKTKMERINADRYAKPAYRRKHRKGVKTAWKNSPDRHLKARYWAYVKHHGEEEARKKMDPDDLKRLGLAEA